MKDGRWADTGTEKELLLGLGLAEIRRRAKDHERYIWYLLNNIDEPLTSVDSFESFME